MREGVNLMRSYSCVMFNVYRLSISEFITAKRKQIVGGFWTTLFPQVLTSKWKMALPKQVSQGVLFMPFQTLYLKSLKKKLAPGASQSKVPSMGKYSRRLLRVPTVRGTMIGAPPKSSQPCRTHRPRLRCHEHRAVGR